MISCAEFAVTHAGLSQNSGVSGYRIQHELQVYACVCGVCVWCVHTCVHEWECACLLTSMSVVHRQP